jgi:hypothetical protein
MIISPRKILANPEILDYVEDPYVFVTQTEVWGTISREEVIDAINILYWRGWETVNIIYVGPHMSALVKNPRAKQKNQPEIEG